MTKEMTSASARAITERTKALRMLGIITQDPRMVGATQVVADEATANKTAATADNARKIVNVQRKRILNSLPPLTGLTPKEFCEPCSNVNKDPFYCIPLTSPEQANIVRQGHCIYANVCGIPGKLTYKKFIPNSD